MKMITALNEDTNLVQDLTTTSEGRLCVESAPRYVYLDRVINTAIAAYAEVLASTIDNLDWTRHLILSASYTIHVDDTCTVKAYRQTTNGDIGAAPVDLMTLTGSDCPVYSADCSLVDFTPGYGVKFAVRNNSGQSANISLSAQLLG